MHVGATMIPAMLSAAQKFNLNGDQILKGLTIGSELICRLALVAPTAMHKQSFHPTAVCGTFGVAAGLSSEGNTVITTTFAPFQTMRCCEQIKVNLIYEPK